MRKIQFLLTALLIVAGSGAVAQSVVADSEWSGSTAIAENNKRSTTGQGPPIDVEYVNCTAARVTGETERVTGVTLEVSTNYPSGVDEAMLGASRDDFDDRSQLITLLPNGSIIIRSTPASGINGSAISGAVVRTESGQERLGYEEQDEQCFRRVRPDINVSLAGVERTSPGTYNVTFAYMNNETQTLFIGGFATFSGQVGGDTPPERFRPGRRTFSIEWTPASESARLTWKTGLADNFAGYDQAVTAQTAPASQYQSDQEPGAETLRIESSPDAEVFSYTVRVAGSAELGPAANPATEDSVTANGDGTVTIRGTVGLGGGDSYEFTGDIVCGSFNGPGQLFVDGQLQQIQPCDDSGGDDPPTAPDETLRVNADPDAEVFFYRVRVDGDAALGSAANPATEDSVTANGDGTVTIRGTVGLGGGDTYEFTGDVVCGSLNGPGQLLVDGQLQQIQPCDDSGGDDPPTSEQTLRIESSPDAEVFPYTARVAGDAELGPAANPATEDSVTANGDGTVTIRGTVGLGGGDSYEFTGDIICASLSGPGETLVDGARRSLEPCSDP